MNTYTIYPDINEARDAEARGETVLTVRRCPVCGDQLLGAVEIGNDVPKCEEAHHGDRPGVCWQAGQEISIIEDEQ